MINLYYDQSINRIILQTDQLNVKYFLEKDTSTYQYLPWKKQYGYTKKKVKLYDNKTIEKEGYYEFWIGPGFATYLLGILKNDITQEQYNSILYSCVLAQSYPTAPFQELRDMQNEDILFLLKYKRGIFSCQTGYGKSQCCAVLTNYFHSLGKKVLLLTPSKKAREELVRRCKKLFNLDIPCDEKKWTGELDAMISSGLMNTKRISDPVENAKFNKLLAGYDVMLCDECEYVSMNDSGDYILSHCTNLERAYAFSGTSDKTKARVISFAEGLSDVITDNLNLVRYFGGSLVYRLPIDKTVNNIVVRCQAMDDLKLTGIKEDGNIYNEIMTKLWTDPKICNTIVRLVQKYPMMFIPIYNLTSIITEWIEVYFKYKFRVLLICAEGFIYTNLQGEKTEIGLDGACNKALNNEIDVILSTSSGYRALDIPNLKNLLLIQGNVAGVVLQVVGRIARMPEMNIISLAPRGNRKIPVYTKGCEQRDEQIRNYYSYCTINDIDIDEDLL